MGGACGTSAHSFVLAAAAVAGHAAAVARPEGGVAAHAGRQQRQSHQRRPAQAEALVAGVAGTRVRVISFRVRHAVVQQAVGAPHEAHPPDAGLDGVWRLLAAAPPIFLMVKHVLTINAARPLAVLFPPLAFGLQRLWLQHHHRPAAVAQSQAARFTTAASLHVTAQRVRIAVVGFRRLSLGKACVGVEVVWWGEFVPCGVDVAVIPVAGEPGSLPWVDVYELLLLLLLLHLETDVTRKHVQSLQRQRGRGKHCMVSLLFKVDDKVESN